MLSSGVRSPWAPAFQETSLNANPHIFLSVYSFLLIDMGPIGNEAKEETDCVLSITWTSVLWHILHKYQVGFDVFIDLERDTYCHRQILITI